MRENALDPRSASAVVSSMILALLVFGCATKMVRVAVPPRIDLEPYSTIGIVDFTSDPTDQLNQLATQQFMATVQASQPNVRFLEIGPVDQLYQTAGRDRIDPETIKTVGKKHNVGTLFTGAYEISSPRPQLRLGENFSSVSASASVRISLVVKHLDTKSGAVLWTNARFGKWSVANVSRAAGQAVSLSVSDPKDQYGEYMERLVNAVADDFLVHYEERPAPDK